MLAGAHCLPPAHTTGTRIQPPVTDLSTRVYAQVELWDGPVLLAEEGFRGWEGGGLRASALQQTTPSRGHGGWDMVPSEGPSC